MILNSFELQLTERKKASLQMQIDLLSGLLTQEENADDFLKSLEVDALSALVQALEHQIDDYKKIIQDYRGAIIPKNDVLSNPKKLLYMRIGNSIEQEDVAKILSISIEALKRYEDGSYQDLDSSHINEIYEFICSKIESVANLPDINWENFPIEEIKKRGWLGSCSEKIVDSIQHWLIDNLGIDGYTLAMHRKSTFSGKSANEYSLLAWQARVLGKAKVVASYNDIPEFDVTDQSWIKDLIELSNFENGPERSQDFLLTKGIILIIEPHLKETYLDGAAMLLPSNNNPVIGMTLRMDRLDNFWFVLLHELGHIFLHLNTKEPCIFDEDIGESKDSIELQADHFALNKLISPEDWDSCMSRFFHKASVLKQDSVRLKVNPAIIAGRIRKEANDYTLFNEFLGHKEVRSLFEEDNK